MMDKVQRKKITPIRFWGFGQFEMATGRVQWWDHVNAVENIQVENFVSSLVTAILSRITWPDAVISLKGHKFHYHSYYGYFMLVVMPFVLFSAVTALNPLAPDSN
jgi:hypothetical protein